MVILSIILHHKLTNVDGLPGFERDIYSISIPITKLVNVSLSQKY